MEGKLADGQVFDFGNLQSTVSHPCELDTGNPCRYDGFSSFPRSGVGMHPVALLRRKPAGTGDARFPRWSVGTMQSFKK